MLKAAIVHDEHYKVHTLYTDLQSPTPATNRNKCWSAPTSRGSARRNAAAMFPSYNKASFDKVRNDDDTLGSFQDLLGNAFVRRSHHFLKYIGGVLKPI
jgi:hypothetical protein